MECRSIYAMHLKNCFGKKFTTSLLLSLPISLALSPSYLFTMQYNLMMPLMLCSFRDMWWWQVKASLLKWNRLGISQQLIRTCSSWEQRKYAAEHRNSEIVDISWFATMLQHPYDYVQCSSSALGWKMASDQQIVTRIRIFTLWHFKCITISWITHINEIPPLCCVGYLDFTVSIIDLFCTDWHAQADINERSVWVHKCTLINAINRDFLK